MTFVGVYLSVISYSNGNMLELINKKNLFPLFGAYARFLSFLFLICLRDNSFPCSITSVLHMELEVYMT